MCPVSCFLELHNAQHAKGTEKCCLSYLKSVLPKHDHLTFTVKKKSHSHSEEVSFLEIALGNTDQLASHFTGEETQCPEESRVR